MGKTKDKLESIPVEFNESKQRIIRWFFDYPSEGISLTDLCTNTSTSKRVGNTVVADLVNSGFLSKNVFGRVWVLKAVLNHPYFLYMKVPSNIMLLLSLYHAHLRNLILDHAPGARAIVLFGSYRRGDDNPQSDIDLAVEIIGDKDMEIIDLATLSFFGYRKNVPVRLHVFSRNKIDLNVFNNIANGIVLEGFLEVRP